MHIVMETICMKCQILFSGKIQKNITNLLSAELAQRVVKVKKQFSLPHPPPPTPTRGVGNRGNIFQENKETKV